MNKKAGVGQVEGWIMIMFITILFSLVMFIFSLGVVQIQQAVILTTPKDLEDNLLVDRIAYSCFAKKDPLMFTTNPYEFNEKLFNKSTLSNCTKGRWDFSVKLNDIKVETKTFHNPDKVYKRTILQNNKPIELLIAIDHHKE